MQQFQEICVGSSLWSGNGNQLPLFGCAFPKQGRLDFLKALHFGRLKKATRCKNWFYHVQKQWNEFNLGPSCNLSLTIAKISFVRQVDFFYYGEI
jgi:hypothetical protein